LRKDLKSGKISAKKATSNYSVFKKIEGMGVLEVFFNYFLSDYSISVT